jgi:cbb3-type cytochrome oxidase maturation protein
MSVVVIQVFVSLLLVAGSLVLFVHSVRQRDFDHADRLALAPLDEDTKPLPETESPCKQNRSNTTTP